MERMTAGDGAAIYGQQSVSSSKKCDGEWGRLLFIFVGIEIITINSGNGSRGGKIVEHCTTK